MSEVFIAQFAGSLLEALSVGGGIGAGVEIDGVEGHAVAVGQTGDELLVAVAVAGAEMEVAVGHGEGELGPVAEMGQADGVAATTNSQQHLLSRRKEVLPVDVVQETLQHQRRSIFFMRRLPSTSIP